MLSGEAACICNTPEIQNPKFTPNTQFKTQDTKCGMHVPIVLYPLRSRSCVTDSRSTFGSSVGTESTLLQRQAMRNHDRYRKANLTFLTGFFLLLIELFVLLITYSVQDDSDRAVEVRVGKG